jgi:hypothetical protein
VEQLEELHIGAVILGLEVSYNRIFALCACLPCLVPDNLQGHQCNFVLPPGLRHGH